MSPIWKPSVTVAAIIARNISGNHADYLGSNPAGQLEFLMIEEQTTEGLRINQPAGHLDPGETLQQAVIRETLEETAHDFQPTALIGTYLSRYVSPKNGEHVTYLRFAFCGELGQKQQRELDHGILRTLWMTHAQLLASQERHRSPLVLQCVEDYLQGQRAPLSLLFTHPSALGAHLESPNHE